LGLGVVELVVVVVLVVELVEVVELVVLVVVVVVVVGHVMFLGSTLTHTPLGAWTTSTNSQSGTAAGKML
jgi:hypothetical protein